MLHYYLYFSLLYWFFPYLLIICSNLKRKKNLHEDSKDIDQTKSNQLSTREAWSQQVISLGSLQINFYLGWTGSSWSVIELSESVTEGRAEPHTAPASSQDLCKPEHWEDHAPSHPSSGLQPLYDREQNHGSYTDMVFQITSKEICTSSWTHTLSLFFFKPSIIPTPLHPLLKPDGFSFIS